MKPLSTVLLIFCAVSAHCPTWAAVIQRDWKTPGDGLLTFDTVNKREWLDVPLSRLSLFPGTNREARYQSVVAETALGGMFAGFTVAESPDVIALAQSAGIDTASREFSTNEIAVSRLIELLGPTLGAPPDFARSQGFLDEFQPPTSARRSAAIFHFDPPRTANLFLGPGDDSLVSPELNGVMLYRNAIPEPRSIWLCFIFSIICGRRFLSRLRQDIA